jgi:hypothetical protein
MDDIAESMDVPYPEEIMNYLPISPVDKEDVSLYPQNITNLVSVNYRYEQYQFAYFGLHLLYMTYIYFTVRKISKVIPDRYKDATVFCAGGFRGFNRRNEGAFNRKGPKAPQRAGLERKGAVRPPRAQPLVNALENKKSSEITLRLDSCMSDVINDK